MQADFLMPATTRFVDGIGLALQQPVHIRYANLHGQVVISSLSKTPFLFAVVCAEPIVELAGKRDRVTLFINNRIVRCVAASCGATPAFSCARRYRCERCCILGKEDCGRGGILATI